MRRRLVVFLWRRASEVWPDSAARSGYRGYVGTSPPYPLGAMPNWARSLLGCLAPACSNTACALVAMGHPTRFRNTIALCVAVPSALAGCIALRISALAALAFSLGQIRSTFYYCPVWPFCGVALVLPLLRRRPSWLCRAGSHPRAHRFALARYFRGRLSASLQETVLLRLSARRSIGTSMYFLPAR